MPDVTADSVAQALVSENGIIKGFNQVLGERGILLFPQDSGVSLLSNHVAIETHTGFRGVKHLIGSIAEERLFEGARGTINLDAPMVRRAIERSNGALYGDTETRQSVEQTGGASADDDQDAGAGSEDVVGG